MGRNKKYDEPTIGFGPFYIPTSTYDRFEKYRCFRDTSKTQALIELIDQSYSSEEPKQLTLEDFSQITLDIEKIINEAFTKAKEQKKSAKTTLLQMLRENDYMK